MSGSNDDDARKSPEGDFAENSKGIGAHLTWAVLGVVLLVVLVVGWTALP